MLRHPHLPPTVRPSRGIALVVMVALGAMVATCSSSPSGSTASTTPHAIGGAYLTRSGTGATTTAAVALPAKWTAAWKFDCDQSGGGKSFVLTAIDHGSSRTVITDQTGLGGGGQKPYSKSGEYRFAIKTACSWNVSAKPTPRSTQQLAATTPKSSTTTARR